MNPRALIACTALVLSLATGWTGAAQGHGALDTRIAALEDSIAQNPTDPSLHLQLARAHAEHEDWEIALLNLARVEQLAPGVFPTDLVRGEVRLAAHQPEAAKTALDKFLEQAPGHVRGLIVRARVQAALGRSAACLEDYRAAWKTGTISEPDDFQEIADGFGAQGLTDEALAVLESAMKKLGVIASLSLRALEMEMAAKRFEAALERVSALQKRAPRPEVWMAKRATILNEAGRTEESRAAWKDLLAHLSGLPAQERGSRSMMGLIVQTRDALDAFEPLPAE